MEMKFSAAVLVLVLLFASVCFGASTAMPKSAATDKNAIAQNDFNAMTFPPVRNAYADLERARENTKKLAASGIPTDRISDTILIASGTLDVAIDKAAKKKSEPVLTEFNERMREYRKVADLAVRANDELIALKIRLDESAKEINDISPAVEIYQNAKTEFYDQRFERVLERIEECDEKLADLASLQTRAEAIYDAAKSGIVNFLSDHRNEILIALFVPVVFLLIFREHIKRSRIKSRKASLELEKQILENMEKKSQEEYFVKKSISESVYKGKMDVYKEMSRELTRELALLKEKEERLNSLKNIIKFDKTGIKSENIPAAQPAAEKPKNETYEKKQQTDKQTRKSRKIQKKR